MNFKFTIDDFLNDFGAGFVFTMGLIFTNLDKVLLIINKYLPLIQNFSTSVVIFFSISMYIIGLGVSAFSNFIDQDFYLLVDGAIRKIKIKVLNKPLYFLKLATFHLFFRRWSVIETIIRLRKKFVKLKEKKQEKYIPAGLKFVLDRTPEDIFSIEKKLRREVGQFDRHYYFKSQFWQIFSNAVLFVYFFNIFVFTSIRFFSVSTLLYLVIFFSGKLMSPMYAKMYLRQMSREISTQDVIDAK
jgi:hypothetical protein